MIRVLVISEEAREHARRVKEFAERPENLYDPYTQPCGTKVAIPGDNPRHVAQFNSFRAVFSITRSPEGKVFRHLSISIPVRDRYPNPVAVCETAALFGFTGYDGKFTGRLPDGWLARVNEQEHCVVIGQEIEKEAHANTRAT